MLCVSLHAFAQNPALSAEQENVAGQAFVQQHRFDQARQAFQRAIKLKADYSDALENLALLELMAFSEDQAGILANQLLQVDPANFNGNLIEAVVLLDRGTPSRALPYFTTLYSAADDDPLVLAGMVECSSQLDQLSQARAYRAQLARAAIDPRDAMLAAQLFKKDGLNRYVLPWLEQAHASSPEDLRILLELYRSENRAGHRPAALKWLYEAKTVFASDSFVAEPSAVIEYGSICIANRMFFDARAALKKAAQLWPSSAEVHHLLGVSLFGLGDSPNAQQEFEEAVKLEPKYVNGWTSLGALHLAGGNENSAQAELKRALQIEPDCAPAYYYLARCYRKEGQLEAAIAALHQAIRIAPRDGPTHAELGGILMAQGKTESARRELQQALTLDDRIASAHYQLGVLLRNEGHPKQASLHLHRARELRESEAQNAAILLVASDPANRTD